MAATARALDMSNVKEQSGINPKHVPAGDYLCRVLDVNDDVVKNKQSENAGQVVWVFTLKIEDPRLGSGRYPYRCTLVENQLWKVRNLAVAAGMTVPKSKTKVDPNRIVGKLVGASFDDEEYEGKMKSVIQAVFPASEIAGHEDLVTDEGDDSDDEDEWNTGPSGKPTAKPARRAAAPVVEDDEDDEDEEEADAGDEFDAMDRTALKAYIKEQDAAFAARKSQTDDDLRVIARGFAETEEDEEEEEAAPPPRKRTAPAKKAAAKRQVTDDDLEELDIDDI